MCYHCAAAAASERHSRPTSRDENELASWVLSGPPAKEAMNTQEHDTTPTVEETAMRSPFDTENMKEKHANLKFSVVVDIKMI